MIDLLVLRADPFAASLSSVRRGRVVFNDFAQGIFLGIRDLGNESVLSEHRGEKRKPQSGLKKSGPHGVKFRPAG